MISILCADRAKGTELYDFVMQFEFIYLIFFAVCLDGSIPGYHFLKGFGSGSENWLLHIEVFFPLPCFSCFSIFNLSKLPEKSVNLYTWYLYLWDRLWNSGYSPIKGRRVTCLVYICQRQKGKDFGVLNYDSLSLWEQGGGWCNSIPSCSHRKMTPLGSSKFMDRQVHFSGILSSDPLQNPGK